MVKIKNIPVFLITVVSLIALGYSINVIGAFYLVTSFGESKFINVTKEEILNIPHSELAEMFLSLYASHNEQSHSVYLFPQHAMYAVIALVFCLKISVIYNWRLSKTPNTYEPISRQ